MISKFIKKVFNKINIYYILLKIHIYNFLNKKKYKYFVGIVSTDTLKNKLKDDLYLKYALNKQNVDVDIISWEDKKVDYNKYQIIVVRSIWGYQNKISEFNDWIDMLFRKKIPVFNNIDLIRGNYNKFIQYNILLKNNIPCIDTKFIFLKDIKSDIKTIIDSLIDESSIYVIKPIVSGSGNNSFLISHNVVARKNYLDLSLIDDHFFQIIKENNNGIMLQPFIDTIDEGELSLIYIDHAFSHAIIRNTSIFNNNYGNKFLDIDQIDPEAIALGNKISEISEYKEYLYLRIDLLKYRNHYCVIEVELLDPCLFFSVIKDKKIRNDKINNFATAISNKLMSK